MTKGKRSTRLRAIPPASQQQTLRDVVIEVERQVSRALSEISVIQMVLEAKKREGGDLDVGEIFCIADVLGRAQYEMLNIEWPIGLDYAGSIWKPVDPKAVA